MRTLGGRQFWGDVYFRGTERIQKSACSEQCRVLNRNDEALCQGSYDICRQFLEARELTSPAKSDGVGVVLLHGILRSSKQFRLMRNALEESAYEVYPVDYPSSQITIGQAAEQLQQVLLSLQHLQRVHLVGHSMGGLVIRRWFGQFEKQQAHPALGRVVMLGTPNQGAVVADWLKWFPPYRLLFGKAGQELTTTAPEPPRLFSVPTVPFGVVAGGRGTNTRGYNPLLPGDNDGTVTVESTLLDGASDFLLYPALHSRIMKQPEVILATKQFLETGRFGH